MRISTAIGTLAALIGIASTADAAYNINDACGNSKSLRNNEFVIPDAAMGSYWDARRDDPTLYTAAKPNALHVISAPQNAAQLRMRFSRDLANKGYSREDIDRLFNLFTTKGNTLFKESVLCDPAFKRILDHERFHVAYNSLSAAEQNILCDAYSQLRSRKNSEGINLVSTKPGFEIISPHIKSQGCIEFYPYLATGTLDDAVEGALKHDFPKAYGIYDRLRTGLRF